MASFYHSSSSDSSGSSTSDSESESEIAVDGKIKQGTSKSESKPARSALEDKSTEQENPLATKKGEKISKKGEKSKLDGAERKGQQKEQKRQKKQSLKQGPPESIKIFKKVIQKNRVKHQKQQKRLTLALRALEREEKKNRILNKRKAL